MLVEDVGCEEEESDGSYDNEENGELDGYYSVPRQDGYN